MRVDLILMKYIKEIISDSTSTTDLINKIIENIEIIKYVINSLNYKVFDQNGNELDLSLCSDTKITVYYAIINEE